MSKRKKALPCECGTIFGEACAGETAAPVIVDWVPDYLRGTIEAIGTGWHARDAERLALHPECAARALQYDGDYTRTVPRG
jgi:hypothetical protein